MRKIIVSGLVIASLAASSATFAAATTATGAITSMDAKSCTVTLDKTVYQFPAKCDFSKLKAGEKVTITFEVKAGKNDATKIEPAK
jgi:Cu/Ag efflux protein CusF